MLPSNKYDMPERKISEFLLKPGAKHAKEFFDVGYQKDDIERLHHDIEEKFDEAKATDFLVLPDGAVTFSVFMELGIIKRRSFRTVWRRDRPEAKPKFVTAYREDVTKCLTNMNM